jgi:hypothetical protein
MRKGLPLAVATPFAVALMALTLGGCDRRSDMVAADAPPAEVPIEGLTKSMNGADTFALPKTQLRPRPAALPSSL